MAGVITNAARALLGAAMVAAGGPFESASVDIVLSSRTTPPARGDVYNAAEVCHATGIAIIADAVITGPYITPAGELVISGGCRHYLTTTGAPYVADQAGQWWIISQAVPPVLLAAGEANPGGLAFNLTAPGIGFDVEIELPVPDTV